MLLLIENLELEVDVASSALVRLLAVNVNCKLDVSDPLVEVSLNLLMGGRL